MEEKKKVVRKRKQVSKSKGHMTGSGRRSPLTEDLIKKCVKYIEEGLSYSDASNLLGINDATLYSWKKRGERLIEEHGNEKALELARETRNEELDYNAILLVGALKKAKSNLKKSLIKDIRTAGKDMRHWTASAWFLERKFPEEFGKNNDGNTNQVIIVKPSKKDTN